MTTLQEQIAVMQHFANGGEVACLFDEINDIWYHCNHPSWNWEKYQFRIAQPPKQKMWQWIVQQKNGDICITAYFFKTKEDVLSTYTSYTVIKPALWTEIEL